MSDADVRLILKEKNIEITKNKLVLDIENNMDSLLQNIENILNLEMIGIERNLETSFSIVDKIFLKQVKVECTKYLKKQIEQIILLSREFIYKESLTKSFSQNYEAHFKKLDYLFLQEEELLNRKIENIIHKSLQKDKDLIGITKYVIGKIEVKILQKVNIQFKERTNIILNNAKETYNKYLLLNKKTN